MKDLVFLVSGNGGNLKFIYHYLKRQDVPAFRIKAIVADRECGAFEFARQKNIETHLVKYNRETNRDDLYSTLVALKPGYVVSHIHKILDESIVNAFEGRLVNLHYSLLPNYKGVIGMDPVAKALSNRDKEIGVTAHFISEEVDAGQIIANARIKVNDSDTVEKVSDVVFRSGCCTILNSLLTLEKGKLKSVETPWETTLLNHTVVFSRPLNFDFSSLDEDFWSTVKKSL